MSWRVLGAAMLGGAIGTGLRLLLAVVLENPESTVDPATLTVNVVGSFALGWYTGWALATNANAVLTGFVGTGLLGGFTTFSAVAGAVILKVDDTRVATAVMEMALNITTSLFAAVIGLEIARRIQRSKASRTSGEQAQAGAA